MELIKRTVKAGNSSAVTLPKTWLDKEVKIELVEKNHSTILRETLDILEENNIDLKNIQGVYLTGSYARDEETLNSDIDILVLTNKINKRIISKKYDLLLYDKNDISRDLDIRCLPILPMIKEAKPLLNEIGISGIKNANITKKNLKPYIDSTNEKIKLLNKAINESQDKIHDRIIYTLVLRIRTLLIIRRLKENKSTKNSELIKIINNISKDAYNRYLEVKMEKMEKMVISKKEANNLLNYLKKQLKRLKT